MWKKVFKPAEKYRLMKKEIMGVKCDFSESQEGTYSGEFSILINDEHVIVKSENIGLIENAEKHASIGNKACYLKTSGIMSLIGPSKINWFLMKINSRGYVKELFVKEEDVIFLR